MPTILRVDQTRPLPITTAAENSFSLRYAFDRSADSIRAEAPGQDYLAINYERGRLAFTLCDGVSQSFYGDLAARILGNALVDWLWQQGSACLENPLDFQGQMAEFLQQLSEGASAQVRAFPLPENMAPMLREVLEKKRALGSETTFTAGYIDIQSRQILLAWMGDSRLRVWDQRSELTGTLLGTENFKTGERWSTRRACVGQLHTVRLSTVLATRLMTYSDGLARLDRRVGPRSPGSDTLAQIIAESQYLPASDDVSFLEIHLGPAPDWQRPRPKPPAQLRAETDSESEELRASWRPTPQATAYEIVLISARGWQIQPAAAPHWSAKFTTLPPQIESIAVRAWQEAEASAWSRLERVNLSPATAFQSVAPVPGQPAVPANPSPAPVYIPSPPSEAPIRPAVVRRHPARLRFALVVSMMIVLVVALGLLASSSIREKNTLTRNPPVAVQTQALTATTPAATLKGPARSGRLESWLEHLKKNATAGFWLNPPTGSQDPLADPSGLPGVTPLPQTPGKP